MSRSSQQRRKERLKQQSDDPKWVAIRNLLMLHGLRISYDGELHSARTVGGVVLNKCAGGYRIHRRSRVLYGSYVASIYADAPLEEWIDVCAKIDRGEIDPFAGLMQAGYKIKSLWAGYGGKTKWLTGTQLTQQALRLQKRYRRAHPKILGIDFETHDEFVILAPLDQAAKPVEPAPRPARRGWRGYVAPADARKPLRQRAADRPPRKIS